LTAVNLYATYLGDLTEVQKMLSSFIVKLRPAAGAAFRRPTHDQ
jgi:hypothetical protein